MKKKFLFLLILLLIPLKVYGVERCTVDEFGQEHCYDIEENPVIELPQIEEVQEPNLDPGEIVDDPGSEEVDEPSTSIPEPSDEPSIELTFDNTKLSSLKIVNYGIAFDPNVYEYTIKIPYDLKELYIIATSYEGVQISGDELINIEKGQNEIVITTNYGGLEPTIYKIKLKRNYTVFVFIIICIILIVGIVLVTIYAIINRTAYLDRKKRESIGTNISPQDVVQASGASQQQIKVVKSVIKPANIQPTVIKKQIVVSKANQPFSSIINTPEQQSPMEQQSQQPVNIVNLNTPQNINNPAIPQPVVTNNQNNIQ